MWVEAKPTQGAEMIARLKSAWHALRGSPVLTGSGIVALTVDADSDLAAIYWVGIGQHDAALRLYEAADVMVARMYDADECARN